MKLTFNKHVKWRKDNSDIFICDCKRSIDLKLPLNLENFMQKVDSGFNKKELDDQERKIFLDFNKMKLLVNFEIRNITAKEFNKAMKILDNELNIRVRDDNFLKEKFEECSQFFIGAFLDEELIGIICGFPREDYLLISELAIDCRFQKRGFGELLVKEFEEKGEDFNKIKVGADDNTIGFYKLLNYKPFLLIQFEEHKYSEADFKNFKILKKGNGFIEAEVDEASLEKINNLKKDLSDIYFQYIFTKTNNRKNKTGICHNKN